ncbi:hypothetical protein [Nocardia implantans]|uniref:Uncharacterized protein n=1 Tax=Nocardia implantans TaxID=3108168 RepID=A0ABU6B0U4_9NOCA|nr:MULTISPECIES: hypothetical protein [unclassified Nocardia]MBF6195182.1 hypothetical protein [Nocardia beijingensis]MEA3530772.1 hypothetical protein [Nocardia sp. CDC192]MEB3513098.1 hypothetical protein [Nocardia sp. CDC186]
MTVALLAAPIMLVAVARRGRRWWLIQLPLCVVVGVAAAPAAEWYVADEGFACSLPWPAGRVGLPAPAAD